MRNWIWLKWTPQNNVVVSDSFFSFCFRFVFFSPSLSLSLSSSFVLLLYFSSIFFYRCALGSPFACKRRKSHIYYFDTSNLRYIIPCYRNYINILHPGSNTPGLNVEQCGSALLTLQFQSDKMIQWEVGSGNGMKWKRQINRNASRYVQKRIYSKRARNMNTHTPKTLVQPNDNVRNYKSIVKRNFHLMLYSKCPSTSIVTETAATLEWQQQATASASPNKYLWTYLIDITENVYELLDLYRILLVSYWCRTGVALLPLALSLIFSFSLSLSVAHLRLSQIVEVKKKSNLRIYITRNIECAVI